MDKITIRQAYKADYTGLVDIWERSVRATHHFLSEKDIQSIKAALIPSYFPQVNLFLADINGCTSGFIGIVGDFIEMLFVDAHLIGHGIGSKLIDFAISKGAKRVDVNEQNPHAIDFYIHKGFEISSRDANDSDGRPYPLLHLQFH